MRANEEPSGGENGRICGKGMNAARQSCEHFSSMGTPWKPMEVGLFCGRWTLMALGEVD